LCLTAHASRYITTSSSAGPVACQHPISNDDMHYVTHTTRPEPQLLYALTISSSLPAIVQVVAVCGVAR
jgi:hypothetical protein